MLMGFPEAWVSLHESFGSLLDTSHIAKPINEKVNVLSPTFPDDGIPKTVVRTLGRGSSPVSMDFHPLQQTLLLVGTTVGDIALWEVDSMEQLLSRNFRVWNEFWVGISDFEMPFQALIKDPHVSVNRVIWSPDGAWFGVAYSRQIVHTCSYHGDDYIHQGWEIDAHVGGVNDLAFFHLNKQLCLITCGDDKTIKVWDAESGEKLSTFEGHEAPVYSVCPRSIRDILIIFSTALDGKIKACLYDCLGFHAHVDYKASGPRCTTMAYSADGTRLFLGWTSKDGESSIVELNESEGTVKRTYQGFCKRSSGVVQFDTSKNRFLAAGDGFSIKFWDMDNVQLLTTVDADGGLPARPHIRFNKDGTLLAVSANEDGIKILANGDGARLLRTIDNSFYDAIRPSESLAKNQDSRISEESNDKSKIWKLTEINEPSQCRSLRLPVPRNARVTKISRLIYTNSGNAILGLASDAMQLHWKWKQDKCNSYGKVAATLPQSCRLWGDIEMRTEDAVTCFALSENDLYLMSASGGKIFLFNMMNFKTMTTFMPPPPVATFLAFHPQDNNIIAIGMDDSSIQIYNVCFNQVKSKLKGHTKRITGLVFSRVLDVLVSSGEDAQICIWNTDGWEKQKSTFLQLPPGRTPLAQLDTCVQFHQDQVQFLVVHETQLAIYEATKLEGLKQWFPQDSSAPISHATFSCDSQVVYASFLDATICVFSASNLILRCRINPSSYLPASVSSNIQTLVIAAHPQEPNQFAVGLSDGGVHVFEPLESEGKWGVPPPIENGSASNAAVGPSSDQAQR